MTTTRYRLLGAVLSTLALTVGAVAIGTTPAHAATFDVTDPGDDASTTGTLRWAMTQAELNPGPDTITISYQGMIPVGTSALPFITEDLTVVGPGSDKVALHTIDSAFETVGAAALSVSGLSIVAGENAVRVFDGGDLTLADIDATGTGASGVLYFAATADDDVTFTRVIADGQFSGGSGSGNGDGIWIVMQGGTATLTDVTANDMSDHGIGITGDAASTLNLTNLTANGNRLYGIGISLDGGAGSLSGATANNNGSAGFGDGGITLVATGTGEFTVENANAGQNTGYGIHAGVTDTAEVTITGMTATNNTETGMWVQSDATATGISVTGATVTGNLEGGVSVGDGSVPYEGTFLLKDSIVSGNTTTGSIAGGIEAYPTGAAANLLIDRTTISDNEGTVGGVAVLGTDGFTSRITSSTMSGNTGQFVGGYLAVVGSDADPVVIDLVNSTISGNVAPIGAMGVLGVADPPVDQTVTIANSTIVDNESDSSTPGAVFTGVVVAISNSIFAGNGIFADLIIDDVPVTIQHSLVQLPDPSIDAALAAGAGNLTGIAPSLGPLANNGGPTLTHLPNDDSPVVNAGDPSFTGLVADQRGQARVVGVLDMGSVEIGAMLAATGADTLVPLTGGALLVTAGILFVLFTRRAQRLTVR